MVNSFFGSISVEYFRVEVLKLGKDLHCFLNNAKNMSARNPDELNPFRNS